MEFWVGYGYHHGMNKINPNDNEQDMVLYFTSDENATVKVEIPGVGWVRTYQVTANSVTESNAMPKTGIEDARLMEEKTYNAGIHITSDKPIVAYAHIYNTSVSGASLLFPVTTLGEDYYSLNFTQKSNSLESNSWAYVIATEDNTTVEIIPSVNTLNHLAGIAFTVPLSKGQIYNLMGTTNGNNGGDLTGTRIHSISSGLTGCKKIAVFSGSGRISINCDNAITTSDNLIQQVFPRSAWGKKFLTVPTSNLPNNYFRIAVSDSSTIVTVDGVRINNLVNNFYYEILANTPKSIIADKPIMVAQYITSTNSGSTSTCGNSFNSNGDPEMIYLSPVEQTIDKITLNSTKHYKITSHYINVVIKSSAINSFTIDGKRANSSFIPHPQDPFYSYAVFTVLEGAHNLKADSGFNAIAYGYGPTESYGYNAGTNIKDLYQFITLKNQYAKVNFPTTCSNTKSLLSITLPFKASGLIWDFGSNNHISPNNKITNPNPSPDSSYISDGRTLYVFSLPKLYSFDTIGTYPLKITANNTTSDGCSGQEEIIYNINVIDPPITNFAVVHNGCVTDTAIFRDASNSNRPINKYLWEFGDGSTDSVINPHKIYSKAGIYNIKHTVINDIGCSTDTTQLFTIDPQPLAKFGFSNPTCEGNPITFTDSSIGTIKKWMWDIGNGNIINNTTNTSIATTYNKPDNYNVSLQVENQLGCKSVISKKSITVHSSPIIDFSTLGACLPNGIVSFTNLTTINDSTENTLSYLWTFGDGTLSSSLKSPQHGSKSEGPFNVNLKATSVKGCIKDSTKVISTVFAQPKALFNYNSQKACIKDSIHFFDASTAKNSTVASWLWSFGDGKTSSDKNPVHQYADSGSFKVSLFIKSATGCTSDTFSQMIYINKAPAAAFTISTLACENDPFIITDLSKSNGGSLKSWYWNLGDGTSTNYANGDAFTKTFAAAGDYSISLHVETTDGCRSDTAKQIVSVRARPITNFILPEVCINDPFASFVDSSSMPGNAVGKPFTYKWNFGDANSTLANPNISTVQNPKHTYSSAGFYKVALSATSSFGCSHTIEKTISVNTIPMANFTIISDGIICSNTAVEVKNTSSIIIGFITKVQIIWDLQNNPTNIETDNFPSIGKIYKHQFRLTPDIKVYQVKMIVFSGNNCFDEKIVSINVYPSPKVTFAPVTSICLNDAPRTIIEAKEVTGMAGSAEFYGKGVTVAGVFNPLIAGVGSTAVKYLFSSAAGCADSAIQNVEVIPNPVVQLSSPNYVLEGGSIVLNPVITGDVIKYVWSPATYLNNPSIKNPESKPADSITYKLTVIGQTGCMGNGVVKILSLKSLFIPNAFSPNADGINDFWSIPVLAGFPNSVVEVFNRLGAKVYKNIGYSKSWDGTFNGNTLPVGVYYYIIDLKNGRKGYTGYVTILK